MNQNQTKEKIKQLIEKYEAEKAAGKISRYSEEETKRGFIEPLFQALGWDFSSKEEITLEEQISGDRVDYGFYLNNRIKFYLEAKPLKADLHREDYAKQSIRYSWNKGVTWAVLTDFESLIVFNALSPEKTLAGKRYFEIPYNEYLERFDQLWLLSKEAFLIDTLDKEAEKHGKKIQKVLVTEKLAEDLNCCRKLLTDAFILWNKEVPKHLIEEGVQKFLDRLIFIRVAEDRKIEPPTLIPLLHQWKSSGQAGKSSPYHAMIEKFRELDKIYNSNLFAFHPFEKWQEFSGATEKVINALYGDKNYFEYDFSAITADVLGVVYENYLGYKLQQTKKKSPEQDMDVTKDKRKRKEQGIYYTPKFIVDYIVQNVLEPILDKCKSINDLQKIKVLDPACGSGSFLVAAMNFIIKKYEEFGAKPDGFLKIKILKNNIYGVDLDEQAVEIARLNLLLNTFNAQIKLPGLENNIKNGNSLISGTDEELKKIFGKNYRDKKPFNWQEEFPEVFKQGGFDCVIGNPPWGANIDKDAEYLAAKYPLSTKAHKDTYKIFIDLAVQKLKTSGRLGFVVPNTFLYQPRYQDIKDLLDNYKYLAVNLGEKIFSGVELPCCVLIAEKEKSNEHIIIDLTRVIREELPNAIINATPESAVEISATTAAIIKNTGLTFDEVFFLKDAGVQYASVGAGKSGKGKSDLPQRIFSDHQDDIFDTPFYTGSNICREGWYIDNNIKTWFRSNYKEVVKEGEWVHFTKEVFDSNTKIVWRQTADTIIAAVMDFKAYFGKTVHAALIKDEYKNKVDIYYALAIFNSQYIDYLYRQKVLETGKVFPQVKLKYLRDLPFVIGKKSQRDKIAELAKKMIVLNKEIREATENSNEWQKIKDEIAKTDKKIDEEVYKLYGLMEEEIKIVKRDEK